MKEIISIFIGGDGIKFGNALWSLFMMEHGISNDGKFNLSKAIGCN